MVLTRLHSVSVSESSFPEAVGKNLFSCLFQLPQATCIPGLMVPPLSSNGCLSCLLLSPIRTGVITLGPPVQFRLLSCSPNT